MKRLILVLVAVFGLQWAAQAQSLVARISWMDVEYTQYHGLLVLYPNNSGNLFVYFYNQTVGDVAVTQNARLHNSYDMYGNCTTYVYCSHPKTSSPFVSYSADNFVFFPNGGVFTQDYSGKWSTAVNCRVLPQDEWEEAYEDFGLE